MNPMLTPLQRRVFGVLIEKSLSQPDYYPMTLNAITAACNQKQNRNPVMECTEGEVARAVHELEGLALVRMADVSAGARANRFRHLADTALNWDRPQQAVLAELLLRGPQTIGELRGRASRMSASLDSIEVVTNVLRDLASRETPVVVELEREPGKSATRWSHLLYPDSEAPQVHRAPEGGLVAAPAHPVPAELEERLARLEHSVAALTEKLARLEAKVHSRLP